MRRRGFLGFLAGAPVAAKAAAGHAAAGIQGMPTAYALAQPPSEPVGINIAGNPADHLKFWLRDLISLEAEWPQIHRNALRNVNRLDPDLADSRSFSTSARIRLQAERNAAREMATRRSFIEERIEELREANPVLKLMT